MSPGKRSRNRLKRKLLRAGLLKRELIPKSILGAGKRKKTKKLRKFWTGSKKDLAAKLNANLPDSEAWFWKEWEESGMKHEGDKPNEIFAGYIPDVINHLYKYVVEVDGGVHLRPSVKLKDALKDRVFMKKGYQVFRLEAYDYEQFGDLVDGIEKVRLEKNKTDLEQTKTRTILRKVSD